MRKPEISSLIFGSRWELDVLGFNMEPQALVLLITPQLSFLFYFYSHFPVWHIALLENALTVFLYITNCFSPKTRILEGNKFLEMSHCTLY